MSNAESNVQIQETLRKYVGTCEDKLIIAFGASPHSVAERQFVTRQELDEVCPDKPPVSGQVRRSHLCGEHQTAGAGAHGSADAAMLEPYEGTGDKGVLYYADEQVAQFCKKANRTGMQVEIHAIGDAAFDQASKALKAALDDYPRQDHRHTIIHACLPTAEGIDICAEYGIALAIQSAFID